MSNIRRKSKAWLVEQKVAFYGLLRRWRTRWNQHDSSTRKCRHVCTAECDLMLLRVAPRSPPAPVMHSPPRKVTVEQQKAWSIPPCISNWKNAKGYTIPLDKRLAADGRGLQQVCALYRLFIHLSSSSTRSPSTTTLPSLPNHCTLPTDTPVKRWRKGIKCKRSWRRKRKKARSSICASWPKKLAMNGKRLKRAFCDFPLLWCGLVGLV